jgi:hypothetical protein
MSASPLALRDATVEFARALVDSGATSAQQAIAIAASARGHAIANAGLVDQQSAAEVADALRRAADAYERHAAVPRKH